MLPWLSSLSVSGKLVKRLRDWCSSRSLQISPLHREFPSPLLRSSPRVSNAVLGLSPRLSHPTFRAAYGPFTPNESEQRSPPLYYRGCWHRVSRGFLCWYRQILGLFTPELSSQPTEVYNPKTFILHAASLRQGFPHCGRFSAAASRRSLGRVSVPVWLTILSDQLPVIALVSHYLTNELIGRGPLLRR